MCKVFRIVFVVCAILSILQFTEIATASEWTPADNIERIWAGYVGKQIYVDGLNNVASCASDLIMFAAADGDPDKVLKLVASAFLSGKKVSCVVDGCNGDYQRGFQCRIDD